MLQDGKTDYKSITIAEDSTAEEFMDFYLDDDIRAKWVILTSSLRVVLQLAALHSVLAVL